ncbi:MAG: TonB-dependent receptor [Sphingorhabdus sp.]
MKKSSLIALPLLALTTPVWAQAQVTEGCPSEGAGEPCIITVTGNLPPSNSETSEAIVKLHRMSGRLENDLSSVPGLQQFRRSDARSANPTSQGVTLRGLGGNASSRAVLVLDDVPQADPFGGWISWPGYDALNLASIRVRKGAGLVSVGPGALAGTIELDSLQGSNETDASLAYGSRNSVDAKASILRTLGNGSVSLSGSYARGDGFTPIIASQRGAVDRPAPYEQMGIALRSAVNVNDETQLQASVRAFTDERDRGFDFSDNQNSGVDASIRLVNRGDGWQWSALGYVQIRDFANRFGAVAADRNAVSLTLDQFAVPSTGLGARFEVRPPVGDNAELRIGGDWRRTLGETKENFFFTGTVPGRNRNAGGRTDTFGGFAEASFRPVEQLTLTAGGRADYWSIANGFRKEVNIGGSVRSDDVFADRSGWEGTGRAGFAYQGFSNVKLRGAAYLGWRLPTLNELYRPFRVGPDATAANELLSPERLKGAEAGLEYDDGPLKLSATIFANRLSNAIANVTQGAGPGNFPGVGFVAAGGVYRHRENLDAIDSKGVELDASINLQPFKLRAGYAYVDAQVNDDGLAASLDGLRPAQVPRHFGNLAVEYDSFGFDAGATLRYVGGQFEDDLNRQKLDDALTFDGHLAYNVTDRLSVTLRGENLLDTRVEAAISSTGIIERATPRTIWFGIRFAAD